ncbi:GNAT family N-acetyltransferase [Paenibacillus sp. WQ 127069]|jgi:ribosomal protein S18 acetylase RimI-like enzyme|uniref:GNAT family N-acetyltransferase n=1 Tax=Paenibacillus baimaensis TaxID=2982185 RepID=A0ABT2UFU5_9BACL|nr:GNAT family N-acetyltransferase [Paenibacillus sp. WQ 127069]MCU6793500.1 GNAT family N-acetyltransferase [Paenibacillus sp. WQ 127069]
MNQITVRKAKIDDVTGLSELFIDFIGKESNLTAMKYQVEIISHDPNYYVAVACDGNRVIGTSMGIVCYDLVGNCNPFMLVENVVVSPEFQGQGVGKLLMQTLEDFGQKNQCNYVMLVSGSNRESAYKFYESIGYSIDQRGFKKRLMKQI